MPHLTSMRSHTRIFILTALLGICHLTPAFAQQQAPERVAQLESKVIQLDRDIKNASNTGLVLFLFGAFCALWAQNTGRSAWLWFFLGFFFSFVTVLFLLTKNSNNNFQRKQFGRAR